MHTTPWASYDVILCLRVKTGNPSSNQQVQWMVERNHTGSSTHLRICQLPGPKLLGPKLSTNILLVKVIFHVPPVVFVHTPWVVDINTPYMIYTLSDPTSHLRRCCWSASDLENFGGWRNRQKKTQTFKTRQEKTWLCWNFFGWFLGCVSVCVCVCLLNE